jgi:hypothetical protein
VRHLEGLPGIDNCVLRKRPRTLVVEAIGKYSSKNPITNSKAGRMTGKLNNPAEVASH